MALVLIGEPAQEVRLLLERNVHLLGHESRPLSGDPADLEEADAALVEPSDPTVLGLVLALRDRRPDLPLIVVSTEPPSGATRALVPVRHITKPFDRHTLAEAVEAAVDESRRSHRTHT